MVTKLSPAAVNVQFKRVVMSSTELDVRAQQEVLHAGGWVDVEPVASRRALVLDAAAVGDLQQALISVAVSCRPVFARRRRRNCDEGGAERRLPPVSLQETTTSYNIRQQSEDSVDPNNK